MSTTIPTHELVRGVYDVIIVGAGHAGCEAALASARMGRKTLLLTMNLDSVASRNPRVSFSRLLQSRRPVPKGDDSAHRTN